MPNGKTIRQIADEIGVTRQAIYKKFKLHSAIANNIKAYSFTVDRVKYYTTEGEKIIKSLFTNNYDVPQETADVSTEQFTSDNLTTAQVDRLTHQLTDIFSAQLTAKDKQIEEKDRQLSEKDLQLAEKDKQIALLMEQTNNLTQALQAAQALAAADKRQLLLQAGKQNEQLENTQKQETAKKSFFSRIFRK